jgi:hypothetical protein
MARPYRKNREDTIQPDGQLRQSALVTTFGPGAMVDLVDRSVVIGGLEHWGFPAESPPPLDEPRLRRSLVRRLKELDPRLDLARENYFRSPPAGDSREARKSVGVRALEFPRWFVCTGCRRLATGRDAFDIKDGRREHDCRKGRAADGKRDTKPKRANPVRFVAACERGHLADFPWVSFAHQDTEGRCAAPELELHENAIGDVSRIEVRCRTCGARRNLRQAATFQASCPGDRPWLGGADCNEPCGMPLRMLVRTASHAYFSQVVSALRLPEPTPDPVRKLVSAPALWSMLQNVGSEAEVAMLRRLVPAVAAGLTDHDDASVVAAVEAERGSAGEASEKPLRTAEYERLLSAPLELPGTVVPPNERFAAYRVPDASANLPSGVGRLVVVPELREVRVQVSLSRFDSISPDLQGEFDFERMGVRPAVLTLPSGKEKWLPACEIRGEGVFFSLDEEAVRAWETRDAVRARAAKLKAAAEAAEGAVFYGPRYYLLHSLAHMLITAISLECGYAASSIRERIYCGSADEPFLAGILLYTGTTGSEGTLGGLVEEGRRLRHHLREAWELARLCSNDPVCAAHDPSAKASDRALEGAACHGCLYIAESSCERFNRFLDRALVVPTLGNDESLAFFQRRP